MVEGIPARTADRKRTARVFPTVGQARGFAQREGLLALINAAIRGYIIDYRVFLLYEYDLLSDACRRLPPHPDGFDEFFIRSNAEADRLASHRNDFRDLVPAARRALDRGAVAFCLYNGREVAHVGWLTTSQQARRALDPLAFEIRFEAGECWLGAVYTVPRFRNRGLLTYSALRRFGYVRDAGFTICRSAVERNNAASNRVQARFEPRIYATGRLLKFFGRRLWKERSAQHVS